MRKRIKSLSVKIAIGFTMLIIFLIIVSLVAWRGFNSLDSGLSSYRNLVSDTDMSGQIQVRFLAVRSDLRNFLIRVDDSAQQDYRNSWEKTEDVLKRAKEQIRESKRAGIVEEVDKEAKKYNDNAEKIIGYTQDQKNKVENIVRVRGASMEKGLTDMMLSAKQDDDMDGNYYSSLALRHLLLVRLYVSEFLDANEKAGEKERVYSEFSGLQENLRRLGKFTEHPTRLKLLKSVSDDSEIYIRTFDEIVKIVEARKVISEVNTQIGDIIVQKSGEINLDVRTDQDKIGTQLTASGKTNIRNIVVIGIIALVMGLYVALFIIRSIQRGIAYAVTVTRSIAEGNLTDDIRIERQDEIGELLENMKDMVEIIRERSQIVRQIANGDMDAEAGILSDKDVLGQSLLMMTGVAKERALMLKRFSGGDLTVNAQVLSDKDELGKSLALMVDVAKERASMVRQFADGDLGVSMKILSDKDELGRSLALMVDVAKQTLSDGSTHCRWRSDGGYENTFG
ncbi:MAG: methyl-accepting chemotaxis protein [Desulfobacteraceae bacterium]|nr:methyl-accepting chemotaxis protein [Desulfobacteraceae bacterium]